MDRQGWAGPYRTQLTLPPSFKGVGVSMSRRRRPSRRLGGGDRFLSAAARHRLTVEPLEPRRLLSAEPQQPIVYWNFDDNLLDQTGRGRTLEMVGPTVFSSGIPPQLGGGKSISFS